MKIKIVDKMVLQQEWKL